MAAEGSRGHWNNERSNSDDNRPEDFPAAADLPCEPQDDRGPLIIPCLDKVPIDTTIDEATFEPSPTTDLQSSPQIDERVSVNNDQVESRPSGGDEMSTDPCPTKSPNVDVATRPSPKRPDDWPTPAQTFNNDETAVGVRRPNPEDIFVSPKETNSPNVDKLPPPRRSNIVTCPSDRPIGTPLNHDDIPVGMSSGNKGPDEFPQSNESDNARKQTPTASPVNQRSKLTGLAARSGKVLSVPSPKIERRVSHNDDDAPIRGVGGGTTNDVELEDSQVVFNRLLEKRLAEEEKKGNVAMDADERAEDIPIEIRLKHSKWEFRVHAIQEVGTAGNLDYLENFGIWFADRNANVAKEAVEVATKFADEILKIEGQRKILWSSCWMTLIEKIITQPKLVAVAEEFVLTLFEASDPNSEIISNLIEFLDKHIDRKGNPAARGPAAVRVAAVMGLLRRLLNSFGPKVVNPKNLIAKAVKFSSLTDKKIREESYSILFDVFTFVRSVDLVKCGLPEKQAAELDRRLAEVPADVPTPCRVLRSEAGRAEAKQGGIATSTVEAWDLMTEVDLGNLLNVPKWERTMNDAQKWKDKKELLDNLISILEKSSRLKPQGDYGTLVSVCAKAVNLDPNQAVVISSIKAIALLATGLRRNFLPYVRTASTVLFKKLRDRAKPVVSAAFAALESMMACASCDAFFDEIATLVRDKNSQSRQAAMHWLRSCCLNVNQKEATKKNSKKMIAFALELADDSTPDVRMAAGEFLGTLGTVDVTLLTAVEASIADLPARTRNSILDILSKSRTPTTPKLRDLSPRIGTARKGSPAKKVAGGGGSSPPPNNLSSKSEGTLMASMSSEAISTLTELSLDPATAASGLQDALEAAGLNGIDEQMTSGDWQDKVAGFQILRELLTGPQMSMYTVDVLCWSIRKFCKNFKEPHVAVNRAALDVISNFPKIPNLKISPAALATLLIPLLSEKIADSKTSAPTREIFFSFCRPPFSPTVPLEAAVKAGRTTVNVKVVMEVCELIKSCVEQFNSTDIPNVLILNFIGYLLESKHVRTGKSDFFEVAAAIARQPEVGLPQAAACLVAGGATTKTVEEAKAFFAKCAPFSPTKRPSSNQIASPREGPSTLKIPQGVMKDLADGDWRVRRQGLSRVLGLLMPDKTTVKSRLPNGLEELAHALRNLLQADVNKNVIRDATSLIGIFADSLGPSGAKPLARILVPPLISKLSDKTTQIREVSTTSMIKWVAVLGPPVWLSIVATSNSLVTELQSSEAREAFLSFLISGDNFGWDSTFESNILQSFFVVVSQEYLSDKQKSVRILATIVLERTAAALGPDGCRKFLSSDVSRVLPAAAKALVQRTAAVVEPLSSVPIDEDAVDESQVDFQNRGDHRMSRSGRLVAPTSGRETMKVPTKLLNVSDGFSLKPTAMQTKIKSQRIARWPVNLTSEDVESLSTSWRPLTNENLHSAMFEKNPNGADRVTRAFSFWTQSLSDVDCQHPETDLFDLLLRWATWRLADKSPKIVSSSLEFLKDMFGIVESQRDRLDDANCKILVPHLAERVGHASLPFREKMRELLRMLSVIVEHPAQLFLIFLRSTASTNKKSVVDVLEEIANLLEVYGPDISVDHERDVRFLTSLASPRNTAEISAMAMRCLLIFLSQCEEVSRSSLLTACGSVDMDIKDRLVVEISRPHGLMTSEEEIQRPRDFGGDLEGMFKDSNLGPGLSEALRVANQRHQHLSTLRETAMHQMLVDYCRRYNEERLTSVDVDQTLWGYKKRIEEGRKLGLDGLFLHLMCQLRKLAREDSNSIKEAAMALDVELGHPNSKPEWPVAFAAEISTVVSNGLMFCFDSKTLQTNPEEKIKRCEAAESLILFFSRVVRLKSLLYQLTPLQLRSLMGELLKGMSLQTLWADTPCATAILTQFNAIMGKDILAGSLRASHSVLGSLCYLILNHPPIFNSDHNIVGGIDTPLALRVFRKFLKKTNSKLATKGVATSDGLEPIATADRQNYIRLLDVALMCIKWTDGICGLKDATYPDAYHNTRTITHEDKVDLLQKLREIVAVCLTICPLVCAVYFRDVSHFNRSIVGNYFRDRVVSLMNEPPVPPVSEPLPKSGASPPTFESYWDAYEWHRVNNPERHLPSPPASLPPFDLEDFIARAPPHVRLVDLDHTVAAGWSPRHSATTTAPEILHTADRIREWRELTDKCRRRSGLPRSDENEILKSSQTGRNLAMLDAASTSGMVLCASYAQKALDCRAKLKLGTNMFPS